MVTRLVVNCATGKEEHIELTPAELVQREANRQAGKARAAAMVVKREYEKKIQAELRKIAEDRLIERNGGI